jgi:hypothetical protein
MRNSRPRLRAASWTLVAAVLLGLTSAAVALAAPPRELSQPTLEGGPFREGRTIVAGNGVWANSPTSFTYRWLRCDGSGTNCSPIPGETAQSYRLVQADVGRTVLVHVTARNADGSTTANSKPSPVIGDDVAPRNTRLPSISGTAAPGSTLTAEPGAWTGAPESFTFTWLQCDAGGNGCRDTGSRGRTYGVRTDDVGRTLRVRVRAQNDRGASSATSPQTAVVTQPGAPAQPGTAVAISRVSLPDRLVLSDVSFTPAAIRFRDEVVTLRIRVSDTRGRLVQGALVLAEGIPFGRVDVSPETLTDGNGVATVTFRPTVRLPLQPQTALQVFLRARKPGENVLAGVSTRRLVQVRIAPG